MTYLLIVLFFLLFILPCTIIIFWLIHCYKKDYFCYQFMMANGTLVRTLIHTDVTKYLSFKAVDGSYVFSKGKVVISLCFRPFFHQHYVS